MFDARSGHAVRRKSAFLADAAGSGRHTHPPRSRHAAYSVAPAIGIVCAVLSLTIPVLTTGTIMDCETFRCLLALSMACLEAHTFALAPAADIVIRATLEGAVNPVAHTCRAMADIPLVSAEAFRSTTDAGVLALLVRISHAFRLAVAVPSIVAFDAAGSGIVDAILSVGTVIVAVTSITCDTRTVVGTPLVIFTLAVIWIALALVALTCGVSAIEAPATIRRDDAWGTCLSSVIILRFAILTDLPCSRLTIRGASDGAYDACDENR